MNDPIDNQSDYWNRVAEIKDFTHPLDLEMFRTFVGTDDVIVDFGCGYGRIVRELTGAGFTHVSGYDTSESMIARGKKLGVRNLFSIDSVSDLPAPDGTVDCILLFAVLTCIPSNAGQKELLKILGSKLGKNGVLYISDYNLQDQAGQPKKEYRCFNGDPENDGVFTHPEGAVFRHHSKQWLETLLEPWTILCEKNISLTTMNGHFASGFQMMLSKT